MPKNRHNIGCIILLTSLPRSGSTWVFKALEMGPGVSGLLEPDHLGDLGLGLTDMHPYIGIGCDDSAYRRVFERAFRGLSSYPYTPTKRYLRQIRRNFAMRINKPEIVIVKSVFSLVNTEWLYQIFKPRVVVLLRNPFSIAHSIHRKWPEARLRTLVDQPRLIADYLLEPYFDLIKRAKAPYEILAAHIGAYHRVLLSAAKKNPSWIVVTHEELCQCPIDGFKVLYERLGLEWNDAVAAWIERTNQPKTDDHVQHVNRVSAEEIGKWKTLLSRKEIRQIREFYIPFDNGYYTDT